jgi:hypothetical protein
MALLKNLPQMVEAVLMQGYQLIKNFRGFRRRGRLKKKGNLASGKIVVISARAARNPVSKRKRPAAATSEKAKLSCTNWGIGQNLLKISHAKEEWIVNGEAGSLTGRVCM